MVKFSIADFTNLIKDQIQTHRNIEKHLGQMEGIFEFVLTQEFNPGDTATFESQWEKIEELLEEGTTLSEAARTLNNELQATLTNKVLPQLVAGKK